MGQASKIVAALKKTMKANGLTYMQLAKELNLSESAIKRSFAEESFSLDKLEKVSEILGVTFVELAKMADTSHDERKKNLTLDQEEAISLDLNLFKIFYLILRQWKIEDIEHQFHISKIKMEKILLSLDKLKLIELHAGRRVKLLVNRNVKWIKNGPIYKIFEYEMKNKFLNRDFLKNNEKFVFLSGNFSEASQSILKQRVKHFEREVEDLIEMDLVLERTQTESMAIVLAMGPINLSIFSKE
ncbi:MAG: helix-turn-helix transcriptional regulator [Oligoflexales bacterium]|nr:helix-turn-helix transcriptional regulator [Oligoflexales bacterium]